jgi:hypothetical protein
LIDACRFFNSRPRAICSFFEKLMLAAKTLIEYLRDGSTGLPTLLNEREAAAQVAALHQAAGGATFNLRFGNQVGQQLFAVSLFPERTVILPTRLVRIDALIAFMRRNADLLADPRCCVGTWFDPDDGVTYLDVTLVLPSKRLAIRLAQQYNQIAIFDLSRLSVIATQGSGKPHSQAPPEQQRLPKMKRGRWQPRPRRKQKE